MRGADRQTKSVGRANRGHGSDFSDGALRIRQVLFADFFAHGHHNPLPANHSSQTESHGHCHLHPSRNKPRGIIDVLFVGCEHRGIGGCKFRLTAFGREPQGFTYQVKIVAKVANAIIGNVLQFLVDACLLYTSRCV